MIKKVLPVTAASLRRKSKPIKKIDKKVLSLIKDLKDTLLAQKDPEGIGLAAPQIGKNVRVFIIKPAETIKAFINPKIISLSKKEKSVKKQKKVSKQKRTMEGCLSIPNYYTPLKRGDQVKVKYLNSKGKEIIETFEGLAAQIIQHETDHLEGVLFIDRLLEQKQKLYEHINGEWEEVDLII